MKHANIPIFIPHQGCPHTCVFCDQRSISGRNHFDITSVNSEIESILSSIDLNNTETEIAFFGGSFTGIDRHDMIFLLETAQKYIDLGYVSAIRLSTRPDYINDEILNILSRYRVKTIELGIQSLSDNVLQASKRGHTALCSVNACQKILSAGYSLVGQIMVGLPCSYYFDERFTALRLCNLGIHAARIYPTVVLCDTELCQMTDQGLYKPLTLDDAVERSCDLLEIFAEHSIPVLRMGLCSSERLDRHSFYAGGYHPALGELIESRLYMRRICRLFAGQKADNRDGGDCIIFCSQGAISKVIGQKKCNIKQIENKFNVNNVKVVETDTIEGYNIRITIAGQPL